VRRGQARPLRAYIHEIERLYRGTVIDAKLREVHGKILYELRLLSDNGHIFTVAVDAATGRPMRAGL
jgi:uncharacterized membrane protein YkoI